MVCLDATQVLFPALQQASHERDHIDEHSWRPVVQPAEGWDQGPCLQLCSFPASETHAASCLQLFHHDHMGPHDTSTVLPNAHMSLQYNDFGNDMWTLRCAVYV